MTYPNPTRCAACNKPGAATQWDDHVYCTHCAPACHACGTTDSGPQGGHCATCRDALCPDCRYTCADCDALLCQNCEWYCAHCENSLCDDCRTPCDTCDTTFCQHCYDNNDNCERTCGYQEPRYVSPYAQNPHAAQAFTFGIEIEINGHHDRDHMETSPLIAGWSRDCSLNNPGAREYQTHPLTTRTDTLASLDTLVRRLTPPEHDRHDAGGHLHISRTPRQTPGRWYWALHALDERAASQLNMRHLEDTRWCTLTRRDYHGKETAVNDAHQDTIELRTFGAWDAQSAHQLAPAIHWTHTMWRFFQHHQVGHLKIHDIERMSRTAHANTQTRQTRIETR